MTEARNYVLVTAAYNEGGFIENTIKSIIGQEIPPTRWVIVSDGSTDDTDDIVKRYATDHPFIQLHRLTEDHPRNFEAQVHAINAGLACLKDVEYEFVGNLDADITFEPAYFRLVLDEFQKRPKLGLAGGTIYDKCPDGEFRYRKSNRRTSVAHAVQLFRKECFQALGGAYRTLPFGGPDTYAEISARMLGWEVASIPELKVNHYRPTGSAGGVLKGCFRQGRMDYSLGTHPLFEVVKLTGRIGNKPILMGALSRLAGFIYSCWHQEKRAVPEQFVRYFRQEQMEKISAAVRFRNWK